MKDNTTQQFNLSIEEREHMKNVLREYVAMTPLRTEVAHSKAVATQSLFSWITYHTRPVMAASLVAIVALSGVSYAAEDALPGDSLYSIKVNVNEEARLLFAFSDEASAKWEIRRAERRLEEAITLARNSKNIPEAVFASLAVDIDTFASRASEKIAKLRIESPEAADSISTLFAQALVKGSEELMAIESSIIEEGAVLALNKAVDTQPLSIEGSSEVSAKVAAHVGTEIAMYAVPTTALTPVIDTVQSRIAGIPQSVTAVVAHTMPLVVTHRYEEGIHHYTGSLEAGVCDLAAEATTHTTNDNEEIFIQLTDSVVEGDCEDKDTTNIFSVSISAAKDAALVSILKDDNALVFEVVEEVSIDKEVSEDDTATSTPGILSL